MGPGKRAAVLAGVLTAGALGGSAFAFRGPIADGYWRWRIERGDEQERRLAARRLGASRCARAVPQLLEILKREKWPHSVRLAEDSSGPEVIEMPGHGTTYRFEVHYA